MNGQWLGTRKIRTNWATRKPPTSESSVGARNRGMILMLLKNHNIIIDQVLPQIHSYTQKVFEYNYMRENCLTDLYQSIETAMRIKIVGVRARKNSTAIMILPLPTTVFFIPRF